MQKPTDELKERVAAKQKRIEARIHELIAEGSQESRRKAEQLKQNLEDVKQTVSGGYENLKQNAAAKLNNWLKDD